MPATIPGIMGALIPNLIACGMIGTGVSKYARGVAMGLVRWVPQIKVSTVDTGSAGTGRNVPQPLTVPTPILYGNLVASMTSQGLAGPFMPLFVTGLSNGLTVAFAQMLVSTNHSSVGTGAGVATFKAPPAVKSITEGFTAAGLNGKATARKARALGVALDRTLASLVIPIAIVGSASSSPSTGVGSGQIR